MFGGARTTAWTQFLKDTAGNGMTMQQKSALYRRTHDVRKPRAASRCAGLSLERCAAAKNCNTNKNGLCYTTKRRARLSRCAGLRGDDCLNIDDCKANKNGICYTTKRRSRRSKSPVKRKAPRRKPTAAQRAASGARLVNSRQSARDAVLARRRSAGDRYRAIADAEAAAAPVRVPRSSPRAGRRDRGNVGSVMDAYRRMGL